MIKKVFISPYSMGYFSVAQHIENIDFFKIYSPDIRFNTLLYASLIQTGSNFFEIVGGPEKILNKSIYIKKRLIMSNESNYNDLSNKIRNLFIKCKVKEKKTNKTVDKNIYYVRLMLTDLLYSLRQGSDFIYVGEFPNIELCKKFLQPDLYFPLSNLFSSLVSCNLYVSSPISAIQRDEVKKFDDIINSDIYFSYLESQSLLGNNTFNRIIDSIRVGAEKLIASNPNTLSIFNNLTHIIPITKLINKEYGELAEIASTTLTKLSNLDSKQNVLIYSYKDIALSHFKNQLDTSLSRFENDL